MPELSIIIVNYNTFELTCDCIKSVLVNSNQYELEIILVDNNSKDRPPEDFLALFPDIHLIKNNTNEGFGRANNRGMKVAKGRYFLLLNSDVLIENSVIDDCITRFDSFEDKEIGVVGLMQKDGKGNTVSSFFNKSTPVSWFLNDIDIVRWVYEKAGRQVSRDFGKSQYVFGVYGCFLMMKREVFELSKGFDPDFFLYFEETEWFSRLKYKVYYIANLHITHYSRQSGEKNKHDIKNQMFVSRGLFVYKKIRWGFIIWLLANYLNCTLNLILSPLMKAENRLTSVERFKSEWSLLFDYLSILKYPSKYGGRGDNYLALFQ